MAVILWKGLQLSGFPQAISRCHTWQQPQETVFLVALYSLEAS